MRHSGLIVASLLASCILVGARCEPAPEVVQVRNTTDQILLIYLEDSTGKVHYLEGIGPGETQGIGTPDLIADPDNDAQCTKLAYIAKTQAGEVIERKTTPTCPGEEWEIKEP